MVEKRKLPARERREPAAKRRASEAIVHPQPPRRRASTPAILSTPAPEPVKEPLPTKIKDSEALPTVSRPQSPTLSPEEYQSIAESSVLLASLERSKKKWLSDGIFERYWTKPKKTRREQIEGKNPPKESMSKVGPCKIVIEPHHFDAMLYTVKDPNAKPPPIQYPPSQRPMSHPGPPNNFQQYQPYPLANQPRQPTYCRPSQAPHLNGYDHPSSPSRTPPALQPRAPPAPPPVQRQEPPQPPKPSPDPVIQMLATRAASNPELKALMRVVASSKASQEQLRAFQAHIDELNAIIRGREQQSTQPPLQTQQVQQPQPRQESMYHDPEPIHTSNSGQPPDVVLQNRTPDVPPHKPEPDTPAPMPAPSAPPLQAVHSSGFESNSALGFPHSSPAALSNLDSDITTLTHTQRPVPPSNRSIQVVVPHPSSLLDVDVSYKQSQHQPPPLIRIRNRQPCGPTPYYHQSAPSPLPPRPATKAVVFEFTSPLTPYGSSTSGHAGSGDRYLFPEHSVLEYLPGGNAVIASFLLVRKVDPNTKFPLEPAFEGGTRSRKSTAKFKKVDKTKDKDGASSILIPEVSSSTAAADQEGGEVKEMGNDLDSQDMGDIGKGIAEGVATREKEGDRHGAGEAAKLKEYYQPVTIQIYSSKPNVLEALSRVVRPLAEVCEYMEDVMNRAQRAPEGYLALRLPRDEAFERNELEEPSGALAASNSGEKSSQRGRSKGKNLDDDSGVENITDGMEEADEEELKDLYEPPNGLVPLCV